MGHLSAELKPSWEGKKVRPANCLRRSSRTETPKPTGEKEHAKRTKTYWNQQPKQEGNLEIQVKSGIYLKSKPAEIANIQATTANFIAKPYRAILTVTTSVALSVNAVMGLYIGGNWRANIVRNFLTDTFWQQAL